MPSSSSLVYDLITRIFELCSADYDLLSRCALVNWEFNCAASRLLYARVVIAPKFSAVLDLRDTSGIPANSNFLSACLPRNAPHVLSLEVRGYLSQRPPGPRNMLPAKLAESIPLFVNLKRVCFVPVTFHEDVFLPVLPALVKLQNRLLHLEAPGENPEEEEATAATAAAEVALKEASEHINASATSAPKSESAEVVQARSTHGQSSVQLLATDASSTSPFPSGITHLTVNQSCMTIKPVPSDADEDYVETGTALSLVQLLGLRQLTLVNPGRAILLELPEWLGRLSTGERGALRELHLKDNCGSITPGVLKSLLPHIRDRIQAFTLGLSYSLTDDDVFGFLAQLPHLRRVHLRYYWQMRLPAHQPPLPALRSFTVTHPLLATAKEVRDFGKWIRRALSGSSQLEVLRLRREGDASGSSMFDGDDEEGLDGDGNEDGGPGIDFFGRTVHSLLTGSDEGRVRARSKPDDSEDAADDGEAAGTGATGDGSRTATTGASSSTTHHSAQNTPAPHATSTQDDDDDDNPPPSHRVAHTGLMDHIVQKHAGTIRVLDLGEVLVNVRQLRQVMERCVRLEVLSCVIGRRALTIFTETVKSSPGVLSRLRMVSFQMSDLKRSAGKDVLATLARKLLVREGESETPSPAHKRLRRVQLNNLKWEALSVLDHQTKTSKFVVRRVREVDAPWTR